MKIIEVVGVHLATLNVSKILNYCSARGITYAITMGKEGLGVPDILTSIISANIILIIMIILTH